MIRKDRFRLEKEFRFFDSHFSCLSLFFFFFFFGVEEGSWRRGLRLVLGLLDRSNVRFRNVWKGDGAWATIN